MIRRFLAMLRAERCPGVGERVDRAFRAYEATAASSQSRLLDIINNTMTDVPPYPPEQMSEAIAEVTRRSTKRVKGEPIPHRPPEIVQLAADVLRISRSRS